MNRLCTVLQLLFFFFRCLIDISGNVYLLYEELDENIDSTYLMLNQANDCRPTQTEVSFHT